MARPEVNRSGELEIFVRVIELGGFSAAARACGMTPSAVSKLMTRLEHRLGTRLINRSTRKIQLTPEGCLFYERGVQILSDLDEAERCASKHAVPQGRLRVNVNVPFGQHFLLPLVPAFLVRYPEITLDIVLTDEVVDLLEQRTDIAVRAGPLKSSSLVARKLGTTRMVIVAAPDYLERHGIPRSPDDLLQHNRLGENYIRSQSGWTLQTEEGEIVIPVSGNVQISDGEALRQLVLRGGGIARLAAFQVRENIAAGQLRVLLEDYHSTYEEIHAVYMGQGSYLPARVRALLDFLVEKVKVDEDVPD